jgi:DNA-directed RNA polymerase subunit RPC12/RpoP
MKVYGKCKNCKKEIGYRTDANTRVEFAMQDGETKKMNCKNCGTDTEFHVDELFVKRSNMPYLIVALGVLTLVIITLYFLFFSDSKYVIIAFGLPFAVWLILTKQDQKRVSDFNKRKLKGRTHNIG